ncbi:NADPH:quinone reductase-like Zn-dependent oxidoreductase/acyl carrier protein, partial [Paenibacillus forsythiae]|nr:NADPH:quinone reductase-like Zn-dependent oxidoreductase/acyl carrier protein [Paenibacillus forsythiae]
MIRENIADALKMDEARIRDDRSFSEYGVDSIIAVNLVNRINKAIGITMQTTILFDFNNVEQLAAFIIREYKAVLVAQLQVKYPKDEPEGEDRMEINSQVAAALEDELNNRENRFRPKGRQEIAGRETAGLAGQGLYRRVIIERPGEIDDLRVIESSIPELKANGVRIAVRAFSLNFGDLLCVKGLYPSMPPYPFTPGFEASGIVLETGSAVTTVRRGDEVVVTMGEEIGGQADLITCLEENVFLKPESLSFEEACALPAVTMTMIDAFRKARLKPGERILIQTATGGTGLIAVQLAQHYGAEIYATAGSREKLEYLEKLSVPHRINYLETDFEQEIMRLTNGKGVHAVINTLSGDSMQKGMNCLAPGGRYIELAMTALKTARNIDLSVFSRNQTFYSVDLRRLMLEEPDTVRAYWSEMLDLVHNGIIRPTICRTFSFDQIKEAYHCMEDRKNIGKIVVVVPENHGLNALGSDDGQGSRVTAIQPKLQPAYQNEPVAIVGMSGRFAKSRTVDELWAHLANGTDLIEEVSRWDL